jgi:type IV pilus assembly protein PilY1
VINRIYAIKDRGMGMTLDESYLVDVTDDLLEDPNTTEDVKTNIRDSLESGNGWYIRLVDNLGEKVLSPPLVVFGDAYFTTYTPAQEGIDDPCYLEEGTGRLYALYYQTGEAVLNYDSFNDACGEILGRSDRSMVIGGSIPSGLVMAFIQGELKGYIGIRGGILRPDVGDKSGITRIYWRYVS